MPEHTRHVALNNYDIPCRSLVPPGEFTFKAGDSGFVEVSNGETDGRVAIDGVCWVWLGE